VVTDGGDVAVEAVWEEEGESEVFLEYKADDDKTVELYPNDSGVADMLLFGIIWFLLFLISLNPS
jgi:hypothetical protein